MTKIILGSSSPRRREILNFFDLPFDQITSTFDEKAVPFTGDPVQYTKTLSEGKALSINADADTIIITADTIVFKDGKIYHKPANETVLRQYLMELQGQWHSVFTAVTLRKGSIIHTGVEETRVHFNSLTPEQIVHYCSRLHWSDKAGGYAIQMGGGLVVNRIEGCYYNVMGLPINTLHDLFNRIGIELWEYVK